MNVKIEVNTGPRFTLMQVENSKQTLGKIKSSRLIKRRNLQILHNISQRFTAVQVIDSGKTKSCKLTIHAIEDERFKAVEVKYSPSTGV